MNGVLVVVLAAAATWLILAGIKTWHHDMTERRRASSFLARHQRNVRHDQLDRVIRESRR